MDTRNLRTTLPEKQLHSEAVAVLPSTTPSHQGEVLTLTGDAALHAKLHVVNQV